MSLDICLQVSPVDLDAAIDLSQLIASVEENPRDDLVFFTVYRRDTDMDGVVTIQRVLSEKFDKVIPMVALDFCNGWPGGPNCLWHSSMTNAALAKAQGWTKATGVLTLEADAVPLRRNWIDVLTREWDNRKDESWAVGHWHGEGDHLHLNGVAMFDMDLLKDWPVLHGQPEWASWDFHHRKLFLKISQDTDYITQVYRLPTISEDELRKVRKNGVVPAIFHGVKDGSARRAARSMLL